MNVDHQVSGLVAHETTQSIIILAAGQGKRFGGALHKALVPVVQGDGSLMRLLRQLHELGSPWHVCIVTGHQREALADAVFDLSPRARFIHNVDYAQSSMLDSLAVGLADAHTACEGAWVLFADTVYDYFALQTHLGQMQEYHQTVLLAFSACDNVIDRPVGVKILSAQSSRIVAIGSDVVEPDGYMVPMVYWPRSLWPFVSDCARAGMQSQWEVISRLLTHTPVVSVMGLRLPAGQVQDIDTPADLARIAKQLTWQTMRQNLLLPKPTHILQYFRANISKDERTLEQADGLHNDRFVKVCLHEDEAHHEYQILKLLQAQSGESLGPQAYQCNGRELVLEWVRGIRLFDLFRLLQQLEAEGGDVSTQARDAAFVLLERSFQRQIRIQRTLHAWSKENSLTPYPIASHVSELIETLSAVLQLPPSSSALRAELSAFEEIWRREDAITPFRDATPKNILVEVDELAIEPGAIKALWAGNSRASSDSRLSAVRQWLKQAGSAKSVRLVDFDFTSTSHLTAPEDDMISLFGHEGSFMWGKRLLAQRFATVDRPSTSLSTISWTVNVLRLCQDLGREGGAGVQTKVETNFETNVETELVGGLGRQSSGEFEYNIARAARALLVRYLRFGGRKLLYRLLNPNGYAVRFRYDSPSFYFQRMPRELVATDPEFVNQWPALFERLQLLSAAVQALPPFSQTECGVDLYLENVQRNVRYWQESPLENHSSV